MMTTQTESNLMLQEVIQQITLKNPIVDRLQVFANDDKERGIRFEANREPGRHEVYVTYVREDGQMDYKDLNDLAAAISVEMLTETIGEIRRIIQAEEVHGVYIPYHTFSGFYLCCATAPLADDDRPLLEIRKREQRSETAGVSSSAKEAR